MPTNRLSGLSLDCTSAAISHLQSRNQQENAVMRTKKCMRTIRVLDRQTQYHTFTKKNTHTLHTIYNTMYIQYTHTAHPQYTQITPKVHTTYTQYIHSYYLGTCRKNIMQYALTLHTIYTPCTLTLYIIYTISNCICVQGVNVIFAFAQSYVSNGGQFQNCRQHMPTE